MKIQPETKYYVNQDGSYIGAFCNAEVNVTDAVEVPTAPEHADQTWLGNTWSTYTASIILTLDEKVEALLLDMNQRRLNGQDIPAIADSVLGKFLAEKR